MEISDGQTHQPDFLSTRFFIEFLQFSPHNVQIQNQCFFKGLTVDLFHQVGSFVWDHDLIMPEMVMLMLMLMTMMV